MADALDIIAESDNPFHDETCIAAVMTVKQRGKSQAVLNSPYGEMTIAETRYPNGTPVVDGKIGGYPVPSHWQRPIDQEQGNGN